MIRESYSYRCFKLAMVDFCPFSQREYLKGQHEPQMSVDSFAAEICHRSDELYIVLQGLSSYMLSNLGKLFCKV